MRRARLVVWSSVVVMIAGTVCIAGARSRRMLAREEALHHAQQLLEGGCGAEAAKILGSLVRKHPRCAAARALLGDARSMQGLGSEAVEDYRAAADLEPDDAQAYYDLAACCMALGRYALAQDYLQRHLRASPQDAYARRLLAFVRRYEGRLENDGLGETKRRRTDWGQDDAGDGTW